MTTPFDAPDWRSMSQADRDLGLNNGVAVAGSADMVAGWERRSADMRTRHPSHLELRYGPRERNRIDFLKSPKAKPTLLFIHGGYWQGRAKEIFTLVCRRPDGAWHQRRADRLYARAGCDARRDHRRNPPGDRLSGRAIAGARRRRGAGSWYPAGLPAGI